MLSIGSAPALVLLIAAKRMMRPIGPIECGFESGKHLLPQQTRQNLDACLFPLRDVRGLARSCNLQTLGHLQSRLERAQLNVVAAAAKGPKEAGAGNRGQRAEAAIWGTLAWLTRLARAYTVHCSCSFVVALWKSERLIGGLAHYYVHENNGNNSNHGHGRAMAIWMDRGGNRRVEWSLFACEQLALLRLRATSNLRRAAAQTSRRPNERTLARASAASCCFSCWCERDGRCVWLVVCCVHIKFDRTGSLVACVANFFHRVAAQRLSHSQFALARATTAKRRHERTSELWSITSELILRIWWVANCWIALFYLCVMIVIRGDELLVRLIAKTKNQLSERIRQTIRKVREYSSWNKF